MKENLSAKLKEAVAYEAEKGKQILQKTKPDFHVTPPVGWINDPNGFSLFQGEYHLFYQYHPYSVHWGPMHWGHCKTKDFITWEQLPCALAPDTEYDGQGCFSGSAVEADGKHILMYTSVREEEAEGGRIVRQTQSIATGDGIRYEKAACNPVITADMLPEGSSFVDFRDPKIWKEGNTFYAVVGSLDSDGSGQIALFRAESIDDWKFVKILDRSQNRYGKMWECPDFFPLDGRQVLITSPQFMGAEGLEFHNGNNSVYFIGDYDPVNKEFRREKAFQIDYGTDFYAPQTLEAADGRRIMIGWLQNWDNYMTPEDFGWSGMMTLPRELSLRDGRLIQVPVRELSDYYGRKVESGPVTAEGGSFLPGRDAKEESGSRTGITVSGIRGRQFDMTVEIKEGDYERFEVALAADDTFQTSLFYEPETGVLTFDRRYSGQQHDTLCCRSAYVKKQNGRLKLRIVMDKYSVEVFVNDGEQAMTGLVYTRLSADEIRFGAKGRAEFEVDFYELMPKE